MTITLINNGLLKLDDLNARQFNEFQVYINAMQIKQNIMNKKGEVE